MDISMENSFNPDLIKHFQEVIFSKNLLKSSHRQISFNSLFVCHVNFLKKIAIYPDEKLNLKYHIKEK